MNELMVLDHGVTLAYFRDTERIYVMVEDQRGRTQFPVMYTPRGRIGYAFPRYVSEEQKQEVRRAFEMMCPLYWEVERARDETVS